MTCDATLPGPSVEMRFWERVNKNGPNGCWLWTGAKGGGGYGRLITPEGRWSAHRLSYELLAGPIPEGLVLDHLCRNPPCVNPEHLEPVTRGENTRRGIPGYGLRTTCRAGLHDITDPANVSVSNGRTCLECRKASNKAARQRKREAYFAEHGHWPVRGPMFRDECGRGHPMSGDNLYVNGKTGARTCRTCHREDERRRREQMRVLPSGDGRHNDQSED